MTLREFAGRVRNLALWSFVYIIQYQARRKNSHRPIVFFDLKDNHWHRYLMILCYFFRIEGYNVVFRSHIRFLSNWASISLFKQIPEISIKRHSDYNFCISDSCENRESIHLSYDYFNGDNARFYKVPMPMVDTMYHFNYYTRAQKLATNNSRGIRIFFAGNISNSYANTTIRNKFNLIDRCELIHNIKKEFAYHISDYPKNDNTLQTFSAEIVIIDRNYYNVNPENLMPILSNCHFALIPPGVVMPQTHFIVEAMSVGCIPITQYLKMFESPLDDSNSLSFDNIDSLKKCIHSALNMPHDQIESLRENVKNYYEKNLTPRAVVHKILNQPFRKIQLNAEAKSVEIKI